MDTTTSSQPLYYQVLSDIRDQVDRGILRPGDKLPSEKELMERYRVSRVTIRKALQGLRDLKIIEHRNKRGNFVARMSGSRESPESRSLFQTIKEAGRRPSSRILSMNSILASPMQATKFSVSPGTPLIKIVRLRLADDVPFAVGSMILPSDIFEGINPWEMENRSMIEIMERDYGIQISHSLQTLYPCYPDKEEMELLNLESRRPLLEIDSDTFNTDGRLVKRSELLFDTEVMDYNFSWNGA